MRPAAAKRTLGVMDHARLNVLTADPGRFDKLTGHLEHEAAPQLDDEPGSRGVALNTDSEIGVAIFASFWVSHDAMRESERVAALALDDAAERAAGTVSVEHFEVVSRLRLAPARAGAGARILRSEVDPRQVDDALAAYDAAALPWFTEVDGLCSALLFANRRTGQMVEETVWRDGPTLAASRGRAASIRVEAVAATGASIRALAEYDLAFTTSRIS
jgi:hypothetical protein